MDEAHRYYASAGAQAINDLKPVLGIELTATPKTAGVNPRSFKNIVYHYPLAKALQDGFVKKPAVATRKDFRPDRYSPEELERIKLEDGIHHHEFVKVAALHTYARQQGTVPVKPFMLVVAQDTTHASQIKQRIEDDSFFGGRYRGKVIEVHSNLSGEESDESMQRLIAVEHDEHTEVVIHVNKLKEGWDVTNLYTIVPLRSSASEILTEQTIGRGLRLPYGKRTGEVAVDRLTIIAHDRFQEILDRANAPDSIIRDTVFIGDQDDADVPLERPQVLTTPSIAEMVTTGRVPTCDDVPEAKSAVQSPEREVVAQATWLAIADQAKLLSSSRSLTDEAVQEALRLAVRDRLRESTPAQLDLQGLEAVQEFTEEQIGDVVRSVSADFIEKTMDIPQIAILPTREVNYGFEDFNRRLHAADRTQAG